MSIVRRYVTQHQRLKRFSYFFKNFLIRILQKRYPVAVSCIKIGWMIIIFYLRAYKNLYPYFYFSREIYIKFGIGYLHIMPVACQ